MPEPKELEEMLFLALQLSKFGEMTCSKNWAVRQVAYKNIRETENKIGEAWLKLKQENGAR